MAIFSKLPAVQTSIFAVMSRLSEEHGALNLGQGFPDFDPPEALRDALARHVRDGRNQYAPMAGVLALRERIAEKLGRDYGVVLDPETELTVTSGATEGIFDVVTALVRPGDEVVMLDPCYDSYEPAVVLQGGRAVHVPLQLDTYRIDFERLRAALSAKTRLVILNFPHNPSGAVLEPSELEQLARLLKETEAFVLADEVYEHIVFDGRAPLGVLSHPELRARSFAVSSFGKAYHATGWKVGWVAAPAELSAELRKVHQFVTFSVSTAAQHAFAEVLAADSGHLGKLAGFYQEKRDFFRARLAASRFRLLDVSGAYFQLADYSAISDEDDQTFTRRLLTEHGVASIPVSVFSAAPRDERLIRFCFAKSEQTLASAAARLVRL